MERTHRGKEKAKRKRPLMKKRSEVWNPFTLLEDNPNKCMCNYCGKQYQCHSRLDGITNMTRHIKTIIQDISGTTKWKSTKFDS